MIALVDCNRFYASCERVFRPDLKHRPVAVLSNNDGCIIAKSNEVDELGFKMGDPYFETRDKLNANGVAVFSSNYALYGDLSRRVMKSLEQFSPEVEIYSIDEAFLNLRGFDKLDDHVKRLKATVEQWTGIPVSVGVAPTKTLAKLANRIAKKRPGTGGTFTITEPDDHLLASIDVSDVWGIGRRLSERLRAIHIDNAAHLAHMDAREVRNHFNVVVEKTVRELQGIACIPFDEAPPHPQHIMVSRGFKGRVKTARHLAEAVSLYASRAAEKARQKRVFASALTVFIKTSSFAPSLYYSNSKTIAFHEARNDTSTLSRAALDGLKRIFRPGLEYQKAGIMLTGLVYDKERQTSLFGHAQTERTDQLMKTMDKLNRRYGRETIRVASSGFERPWWMARERLSPCYTTRWSDLPVIDLCDANNN